MGTCGAAGSGITGPGEGGNTGRAGAVEPVNSGVAGDGVVDAIWTAPPADEIPPIGTGNKTVLDRETGQISHWPAWTIETLTHSYSINRHWLQQQTLSLPRTNIRLPEPPDGLFGLRQRCAIAAPDGRLWWQWSALSDDIPEHHPRVAQWLADQRRDNPAGLVRGAARHSVLWVLSDALQDLDAADLASCHLKSQFPCATCVAVAVHFGLADPAFLAAFGPHPGELEFGSARPSGAPSFDHALWPEIAFDLLERGGVTGDAYYTAIPRVEAARPILERFPVATSQRRGAGRDNYIQPFHLGVTEMMKNVGGTLAAFGAMLGAAAFPLGQVEPRGIICVDEHGRLFVLDEGGAWYCGRDIDTALRMLLEGLKMPRVRSDGSVSF